MSCESKSDLLDVMIPAVDFRLGLLTNPRLIVAVSGGADSICLLHLLHRLSSQSPMRLTVVHVDHGLRGAASRKDAGFVQAVCEQWGEQCVIERLRLASPEKHKRRDESSESQWRDARYRALTRQAKRRHAAAIALGHTLDDLAETIVMRLIRGAGARGLGAFGETAERDGVTLWRPLLSVTRKQVEAYCAEQGLEWREDASNRDRKRLRNQVRLDLLPVLERDFNPSIRETLARTAETLRVDDEYLEKLAREKWSALKDDKRQAPRQCPLGALRSLPLALLRRVCRLWIEELTRTGHPPVFSECDRLVELILHKRAGARFELRRQWSFQRERDQIRVRSMNR